MAVITYKCPRCDGPLKWDGGKKKFICEYCDSVFSEEEIESIKPDEQKAQTVSMEDAAAVKIRAAKAADIKIYNCPSCGAQIAEDATTAASTCFYCGNPVVIMDKFEGEFDPDYVIPFAIDKANATDIFRSWLRQHRYVPESFYKNRIDEIKGVYFPYWVYSGRLRARVSGEGHTVNIYRIGDMEHIETSVYEIKEQGEIDVKNLSCIALTTASKELCESVMPFKPEEKEEFDPAYLQGYTAEIRDIEKKDIEEKIRLEAESFARDEARAKAVDGYESADIKGIDIEAAEEKLSYALMPVWTLTYKGADGKIYYFCINGQTGKTCGVLPVDNVKLLWLFLCIALPVFVILILLFYFVL